MNFKIIETEHDLPDVLLFRDRDEGNKEIVNILAIGILEDLPDMFLESQVIFDSANMAKSFIKDFTQKSAETWCKKNKISYE